VRLLTPVDALVIDEASAALETESLMGLHSRPSRCFIVGDQKQLTAMVSSPDATRKGLSKSLMTRLIEDCHHPYMMLDTQYRMHPAISRFPSSRYYNSLLKDGENVKGSGWSLNVAHPVLGPLAFVNVRHGQEFRSDRGSFTNEMEGDLAVRIASHVNQNPNRFKRKCASLAIISMYSAQVRSIQRKLSFLRQRSTNQMRKERRKRQEAASNSGESLNKWWLDVTVCSVDSFQGSEADFVILSLVRANKEKRVGFLADSRRLNVALTRARRSLVILANADTFEQQNSAPDVRLLLEASRSRGCLFDCEVLNKVLDMDGLNH